MPRSKFNKVMLPLAATINPFVAGIVNAYILEHLVKYINPTYTGTDTIYRAGFGIAFCASAVQSMAMLYYQKVMDEKETLGHGARHSHSHSHEHHHKLCDEIIHHLTHIFGLYIYNFAFAAAGLYNALLGDEIPEDEKERLMVCAIIAFGGLVYTYVEAKYHELFISEAEHEHGNMFMVMCDQAITQVFRQDKTLLQKFKQAWLAWGGLGSHALAGYFATREATKAIGLLFFGKYPSSLTQNAIAISLCTIGSIMHTGSEASQSQKCKGPRETWRDIKAIENFYVRCLLMLFVYMSLCLIVFHVMPESFGLNEEITPEDASTMERSIRVIAFFIAFGLPDCVMSWIAVEGAVHFVKELYPANSRSPLLANGGFIGNNPVSLDTGDNNIQTYADESTRGRSQSHTSNESYTSLIYGDRHQKNKAFYNSF